MSSEDDVLLVAAALADRLAHDAVWHDDRCCWIGAQPGEHTLPTRTPRTHAALGPDFYNGTGGIALFLAEAAAVFDDDRLRSTALGALRHAFDHAHRIGPDERAGLYAGQIGIAYAGARIAQRTGAEVGMERARDLLLVWRGGRSVGAASEVMHGCAGAVTGLVACSELIDEPWILESAIDVGEVLLTAATRSPGGWSWSSPDDSPDHHLCGLSHGAAGIGHALLELYAATRDARFLEAGRRAFDYERSWFESRGGTWPDLRYIARATGWDTPAPTADSWCHGAPGIALSRLRGQRLVGTGAEQRDADAALALTEEIASRLLRCAPDDYSLCHGAAGVADVLLYAADARPARARYLRRLASDIGALGQALHHRSPHGFPCGLPHGETPGLFLGHAGIGLFYLRLGHGGIGTPLIVHRSTS